MKNIKRYSILLLFALIFTLVGCKDDFLNTKIDTSSTQEIINSSNSSFFRFAVTPYTFLRYEFFVIDNNLFDVITDDAETTSTNAYARNFTLGSWNAFQNPDNYYSTYYSAIRSANYFLEIADNYKTILGSNRDTISASGKVSYAQDTINAKWYRAEAHIARAYYYFELLKRYGGVPLVTRTFTVTDNTNIARSSFDDVSNFIVSEINNNVDQLQLNWRSSTYVGNDGRFSQGSAMALKSRVLLYAASPLHNSTNDVQKWQTALLAAADVINLKQYSLEPKATFSNYFLLNTTLTSKETIWAIRNAEDNSLEKNNYPIGTPGGNSGVCPSHNLVSDFEYIGIPNATNPYLKRDPRLSQYVVTQGSTWNNRIMDNTTGGIDDMSKSNTSKTGYYLKKFLNPNLNLLNNQTVVHNWVVFRYAEILLNYAEAMNELYGPDNNPNGLSLTAKQALNLVRTRSDLANVTTSDPNTFRIAVKHERRIELAFENHRYWDLLRWKDAEIILNQPIQGVSVTKNTDGTCSYQVRNVGTRIFDANKMYYYPIPQSEISKSNGVLVQNPNW